MLKRCYYIANSYDGAYFVLTDDLSVYAEKMASYVVNLENSRKTNSYSFGSIEISASDYEKYNTEATSLEKSLIDQKIKELETIESILDEDDLTTPPTDQQRDKSKPRRNHLRLV